MQSLDALDLFCRATNTSLSGTSPWALSVGAIMLGHDGVWTGFFSNVTENRPEYVLYNCKESLPPYHSCRNPSLPYRLEIKNCVIFALACLPPFPQEYLFLTFGYYYLLSGHACRDFRRKPPLQHCRGWWYLFSQTVIHFLVTRIGRSTGISMKLSERWCITHCRSFQRT